MTGRTIVYLPNWLGDMVMAVPFLHALRAYVNGEVWAIGKSRAVNVYHGLDLFDKFISIDAKGMVPFLDLVSRLRALDFKRGIALPHSFRSALLLFAAGIPERIGYSRNKRGFMLTRRITEAGGIEPTVEHYLRIVDNLMAPRLTDTPFLLVTEDEAEKFDRRQTDVNRPYIVMITGAQYGPSKCWPEEYFSRLADLVADRYGMKVYLVPGRDEMDAAQRIIRGAARKDLVKMKSLDMVDLKVCLSRAAAVVSNDTGPRHISAALAVPTIVLMGPMDERYTDYPASSVYPMVAEVPCRPCNKKKCDGAHACMRQITPEDVFSLLRSLLNEAA